VNTPKLKIRQVTDPLMELISSAVGRPAGVHVCLRGPAKADQSGKRSERKTLVHYGSPLTDIPRIGVPVSVIVGVLGVDGNRLCPSGGFQLLRASPSSPQRGDATFPMIRAMSRLRLG
jgi:hypothetical protein